MTQDDYVSHFLNVLGDICDRARIVIKLEETWYSRSLFEYARKYHYKGIQVSGCLKKISRLASEANQTIPTLLGDLAGIFSTGATSAAEDSTPIYAYFTTIVETSLRMLHTQEWLNKEPREYLCCIFLVTRCLGGYPITIYSQFCTRVQDVLSSNLHLVRTVLKDPILGKHIARIAQLAMGKKDFISLIQDPQSLPLNIPVQSENFLKREVKKGLDGIVVNKDLRALFDINTEEEKNNLISDLSNIKPCNPRLINKLYALSNIGLQEKWASIFSNTRSIQQLAFRTWSNEQSVILTVKQMETKYASYLQRRKNDTRVKQIKDVKCITTYTQLLREEAWGIQMEGVTMPPQQEQTCVIPWQDVPYSKAGHAALISEQPGPSGHKPTERGMYTPYFGSITQMRAKRAPLQVVEVGSMVSSLKQLMELHGWVKGNTGLTHLIEKLIQEKTTLSIDELQKYTARVYSGAISHRLPCPALRRGGMANQNLNHSSFFKIVSDLALHFAKSGENYTICFQASLLYALSFVAHMTELGIPIEKSMALLFLCTACTWLIPPETFSLEDPKYKGVQLPHRIEQLHHKDIYTKYPLHTKVDENISYAVQMGRKFAAWIVNRRMIHKITALENRAMEESLIISFVNLSEFVHVMVPLFLKSFVFFCMVYDHMFFILKNDYYNEVLEGYIIIII